MSKQIDKTNILNYLKEHYSEFKNKYNVEKIGLFGSYARDEATENSDIDIFVKMKYWHQSSKCGRKSSECGRKKLQMWES